MINLSLGTIFEEDFDILHRVCKELFLGGCKIIAAENNYGEISAPACFEEVISVQRTKIGHIMMYNRRKRKKTLYGRRLLTDLEGDTFFAKILIVMHVLMHLAYYQRNEEKNNL